MTQKSSNRRVLRHKTGSGKKIIPAGIFAEAFSLAKQHFFLPLALLLIPSLLYLMGYIMDSGEGEPDTFLTIVSIVFMLASYLLFGLVSMIMIKIYDSKWKNMKKSFDEAVRYAQSRFVNVLVVLLAYFAVFLALFIPVIFLAVFKTPLLIYIWFLLAIIAAVILWLNYGQAWIITLLEPKIKNSFNESRRICRGRQPAILFTYITLYIFLYVIPAVTGLAGAFLIPKIPPLGILFLIVLFILMIAIIPLSFSFPYALYKKLHDTASR